MEKVYMEDTLGEKTERIASNYRLKSTETGRERPDKIQKSGYEVLLKYKQYEKFINNGEGEVNEAEEEEVKLEDGVEKEEGDDFGYHGLMGSESEDEVDGFDIWRKNRNHKKNVYKPRNFVISMNETEYQQCPIGLILDLIKDHCEKKTVLNIENPFPLYLTKDSKKTNATTTKKLTQNATSRDEKHEEDLIRNTENSLVKRSQYSKMYEKNIAEALKIKSEYSLKKICYEIELVKLQLQKLHDYNNRQKSQKSVKLSSEETFKLLESDTKKVLNEYEDFIKGRNLHSAKVRIRLQEFSEKCRIPINKFMIGILNAYEKNLEEKRTANESINNYSKWKLKLRQLVSIWEVANSNGIEMMTTSRYLILKRFLTLRAAAIQNDTGITAIPKEYQQLLSIKNIMTVFTSQRNPILHPILVMKSKDMERKVFDFIGVTFLLYSIITVPIRLFMGIENNQYKMIEKFVDMYFYIDIMLTLRTSFKDKNNEDRFNINDIMIHYLKTHFLFDFFSTIPWYFLFARFDVSVRDTIRIITHTLKIFRLTKLLPLMKRLEELKFSNYIRILKLILIFYLVAHWMAAVLFSGITGTLKYDLLNKSCYKTNLDKNKYSLTSPCIYVISFYSAAYTIPGQYNAYMDSYSSLSDFREYIILLLEFLIGQFLSAYVFGGMTSIIQNLDKGHNFFSEKTDLLREHIYYYEMGSDVQDDVTVYYDYLWQRHKDIIYGKNHFDLLSKSLREKFENLNLLGHEVYLHKFSSLNNPKLTGLICRELKKVILFPHEILYEEGSMIKGIYILINGDLEFNSFKVQNTGFLKKGVYFHDVMENIENLKDTKPKEFRDFVNEYNVTFPLTSAFLKTGRTYQRCSSVDFTDLLHLPLKAFDDLVTNFPVESHSLKHDVMSYIESNKIFDNNELFDLISRHSARSVGKNFETQYNKLSIWISIPIPISQRKIATNYVQSFVKKVKNQWKEILRSADMNITLNSYLISNMLKSERDRDKKEKEEANEKNNAIQNGDYLNNLKNVSRILSVMADDFMKLYNKS